MAHQHVTFGTTDAKTYLADDTIIRISARGPRGGVRDAEFITRDQARDLVSKLLLALDDQGETFSR